MICQFQEENNVPKNCGSNGGSSRWEGQGQLRRQQSDQEGNYHVNAQVSRSHYTCLLMLKLPFRKIHFFTGQWWWQLVTCQPSQSRGRFKARCDDFCRILFECIHHLSHHSVGFVVLGRSHGGRRILGAGRPWEDSSRAAAYCKNDQMGFFIVFPASYVLL